MKHDELAKVGFKNKRRMRILLRFVLTPEQFEQLDEEKIEFLNEEFVERHFSSVLKVRRGDIFVKVKIKGEKSSIIFVILVEHKSTDIKRVDFYKQVSAYNSVLIREDMYPILTIALIHGDAPHLVDTDLQGAFGWSDRMRGLFGRTALNFGIKVVDARKMTKEQIEAMGSASSFLKALQDSKHVTEDTISSVLDLYYINKESLDDYLEHASILVTYLFNISDHPIETFQKNRRKYN